MDNANNDEDAFRFSSSSLSQGTDVSSNGKLLPCRRRQLWLFFELENCDIDRDQVKVQHLTSQTKNTEATSKKKTQSNSGLNSMARSFFNKVSTNLTTLSSAVTDNVSLYHSKGKRFIRVSESPEIYLPSLYESGEKYPSHNTESFRIVKETEMKTDKDMFHDSQLSHKDNINRVFGVHVPISCRSDYDKYIKVTVYWNDIVLGENIEKFSDIYQRFYGHEHSQEPQQQIDINRETAGCNFFYTFNLSHPCVRSYRAKCLVHLPNEKYRYLLTFLSSSKEPLHSNSLTFIKGVEEFDDEGGGNEDFMEDHLFSVNEEGEKLQKSYSVPYLFRKYHYRDFLHYSNSSKISSPSYSGETNNREPTTHVLCNESSIEPKFGFQLPCDYLKQIILDMEKSLYTWRLFSEIQRKEKGDYFSLNEAMIDENVIVTIWIDELRDIPPWLLHNNYNLNGKDQEQHSTSSLTALEGSETKLSLANLPFEFSGLHLSHYLEENEGRQYDMFFDVGDNDKLQKHFDEGQGYQEHNHNNTKEENILHIRHEQTAYNKKEDVPKKGFQNKILPNQNFFTSGYSPSHSPSTINITNLGKESSSNSNSKQYTRLNTFLALSLTRPLPYPNYLIAHTNTEYDTVSPKFGSNENGGHYCPHNKPRMKYTLHGHTAYYKNKNSHESNISHLNEENDNNMDTYDDKESKENYQNKIGISFYVKKSELNTAALRIEAFHEEFTLQKGIKHKLFASRDVSLCTLVDGMSFINKKLEEGITIKDGENREGSNNFFTVASSSSKKVDLFQNNLHCCGTLTCRVQIGGLRDLIDQSKIKIPSDRDRESKPQQLFVESDKYKWFSKVLFSKDPIRNFNLFYSNSKSSNNESNQDSENNIDRKISNIIEDYQKQKCKIFFSSHWTNHHINFLTSELDQLKSAVKKMETTLNCSFRSSTEKKNPDLQYVPTNLHMQNFSVADFTPLETKKINEIVTHYDFVTCGAMCAHSYGYKEGGLLSLQKKLFDLQIEISLLDKKIQDEAMIKKNGNSYKVNHNHKTEHIDEDKLLQFDESETIDKKNHYGAYSATGKIGLLLEDLEKKLREMERMVVIVGLRRAVCLSQTITVVTTSFISRLEKILRIFQGNKATTKLTSPVNIDIKNADETKLHDEKYAQYTLKLWSCGKFLMLFEALVSGIGKELFMLEDTAVAIELISKFHFSLHTMSLDISEVHDKPQSEVIHDIKINMEQKEIQLYLSADLFEFLSPFIEPKMSISIEPILFAQGIDVNQTLSNTFSSIRSKTGNVINAVLGSNTTTKTLPSSPSKFKNYDNEDEIANNGIPSPTNIKSSNNDDSFQSVPFSATTSSLSNCAFQPYLNRRGLLLLNEFCNLHYHDKEKIQSRQKDYRSMDMFEVGGGRKWQELGFPSVKPSLYNVENGKGEKEHVTTNLPCYSSEFLFFNRTSYTGNDIDGNDSHISNDNIITLYSMKTFDDLLLNDEISFSSNYKSKHYILSIIRSKENIQTSLVDTKQIVIHPFLRELADRVYLDTGKFKNIQLLEELDQFAFNPQIGAIEAIFCKSGKDRTGMASTLLQGKLLTYNHLYKELIQDFTRFPNNFDYGEKEEQDYSTYRLKSSLKINDNINNRISPDMRKRMEHHFSALLLMNVQLMRSEGTRLLICKKNIGRPVYSFNSIQLQFLPEIYRPPSNTFETLVSSYTGMDNT